MLLNVRFKNTISLTYQGFCETPSTWRNSTLSYRAYLLWYIFCRKSHAFWYKQHSLKYKKYDSHLKTLKIFKSLGFSYWSCWNNLISNNILSTLADSEIWVTRFEIKLLFWYFFFYILTKKMKKTRRLISHSCFC